MKIVLPHSQIQVCRLPIAAAVVASALVSGCGGGGGSEASAPQTAAPLASASTSLQMDLAALPADIATKTVEPAFYLAPTPIDEPNEADLAGDGASTQVYPHYQSVPSELRALSSRNLTPQAIAAFRRVQASGIQYVQDAAGVAPMATSSSVVTYTPAQIRAAYGMPALPTAGSTLTATQAAQMGAGQTIYIVAAYHDPNVAAELAAFNTKFALPACTSKAIATAASLPLATASSSACEFSVVYANTSGGMNVTPPGYNSSWATEIALDVQWAHATAPLARIVLIEAPDATTNSLLAAIKLANAMGPGIVSMSFGSKEGSWTASVDSAFNGSNMTYLAATGDSGVGVSWPAVSTKVLAVGGTSLRYSGSGARSEVSWSGTGGGMSAYLAVPGYQTTSVPGLGSVSRRTVADVAFNADPTTGQYVAVLSPGSSTASWFSAGGTSLATPQWAGLIAVANASRISASKSVLGLPHSILYTQIATVPGSYAASFADITQGSNGSCATCAAHTGYDTLSGLGTPNVGNLITQLTSTTNLPSAPTVTPASISGSAGTPLTFTVAVNAANAVTYALSGAPSGMSISTSGVVSWASPVAGSYTVTVTATDKISGLSGQGAYTITIAAKAPLVTGGTISGKPNVALSFPLVVTSLNPVSYSLSGAPTGMTVSSSGIVSWLKPVAGSYTVIATVKDSKTGLTGQASYSIQISSAGPLITATPITGVAGKKLTGSIAFSDPGASRITITVSNAPLGMQFSVSGQTLQYVWLFPLTGSYSLSLRAIDSAGLSTQVSIPLTVTAK
ncbi:MAG: S53 family peptidase [Proteobacteria bacterium]|nr:S53 family peptidase [Pseudomonadota bacterium]